MKNNNSFNVPKSISFTDFSNIIPINNISLNDIGLMSNNLPEMNNRLLNPITIPEFSKCLSYIGFEYAYSYLVITKKHKGYEDILFRKEMNYAEALEILNFLANEKYYDKEPLVFDCDKIELFNRKYKILNYNSKNIIDLNLVDLETGLIFNTSVESISLSLTLNKMNSLMKSK